MKKIFSILVLLIFVTSCASNRHGVGNTPQAAKSKREQQKVIASQFRL